MNTENQGGPVVPHEHEIGDKVFKRYPLDNTTVDYGRDGVAPELRFGSMEGVPIELKGLRVALHSDRREKNDGGSTQDFRFEPGAMASYSGIGWEYYIINRDGTTTKIQNMPAEGTPQRNVTPNNSIESMRILVINGDTKKELGISVSRNASEGPSEDDTFSLELSYKK